MPCPHFMTCEEDKICVACLEKIIAGFIKSMNAEEYVCVDCFDDAMETSNSKFGALANFKSDYL